MRVPGQLQFLDATLEISDQFIAAVDLPVHLVYPGIGIGKLALQLSLFPVVRHLRLHAGHLPITDQAADWAAISSSACCWAGMTQDLNALLQRSRALREQADGLVTRSRKTQDAARDVTAYAASLCVECAMVLEEVCFRQSCSLPYRHLQRTSYHNFIAHHDSGCG